MKAFFAISASAVLLLSFLTGCDLFVDDVGSASIYDHKISGGGDFSSITVFWHGAEAADQHILQRSAPDDGVGFLEISWGEGYQMDDYGGNLPNGFVPGHRYVYRVRGYSHEAGEGPWSDEYTVTIPAFLPPASFTAELIDWGNSDFSDDLVRLQWDMVSVDGAEYEIFRSDDPDDSSPTNIATISDSNTTLYEDDAINAGDAGKTFYYWIRTYHSQYGETDMSGPEAVDMNPVTPPVMHDAVRDGDTRITVRWNPVDGANDYMLYRATSNPEQDGAYTELWDSYKSTDDAAYIQEVDGYLVAEDGDIQSGTNYYYKAKSRTYALLESALSGNYASAAGGGGTGSWLTLGSSDFAQTAEDMQLLTANGNLFVLFPDGNDSAKRLKAMSHDGSDSGSWSDAGGYISIDASAGDEVNAYSDGTTIYVAYGETASGYGSGGSPRLFVKSYDYDGSAWNVLGSSDGITIYDDPDDVGIWGSVPAVAAAGSTVFMVYRTTSVGLVSSLSYSGSGTYWEEIDPEFWYPDNNIASSDIALEIDSAGNPLAALEHGVNVTGEDSSFDFYSFSGGAWSSHSSFTAQDDGSGMLYIFDFLIDGVDDTPYFAFETSDGSGYQASVDIYSWSGTSWGSTGFVSQLSNVDFVEDIAVCRSASGGGILAAAAYYNTASEHVLEVWEYDGSSWTQLGSDIVPGAILDDIDLALDSQSRPVLVYEDDSGNLTATSWRE